MRTIYVAGLAALVPLCIVAASCALSWDYQVDAVQFTPTPPLPNSEKPTPDVWIDTHLKISGMFGGTIKSSAPFDVTFDFTDANRAYAAIVVTGVSIRYDDKTVEKATDELKLPIRVKAREQEVVNSMSGGEIVKSNVRLLSGRIPGIVTREQPFTLKLQGHFQKLDGTQERCEIEQHYDVEKETGTRSWAEVMESA